MSSSVGIERLGSGVKTGALSPYTRDVVSAQLVPLFNQVISQSNVQNTGGVDDAYVGDSAFGKGLANRTVDVAQFAASAVRIVQGNLYLQTTIGEVYVDQTVQSSSGDKVPIYVNNVSTSIEYPAGTTNIGIMQMPPGEGGDKAFFDRMPRLSDPRTVAITAGSLIAVRTSINDWDPALVGSFPTNRMPLRFHSGSKVTDLQILVNTTNIMTSVGTVGGASNACFSPLVFGVPAAWRKWFWFEGDSLSVGNVTGDAAGTGYASVDVNGASSAVERAVNMADSTMTWIQAGCSGSALCDYTPQSARSGINYRPSSHAARNSIVEQVRPPVIVVSFYTNEFSRASSGFVASQFIAMQVQMARDKALKALAIGAQIYFIVDPLQTTWTAGGTNYDPTIAKATFMTNQNVANDAVASGYTYVNRSGVTLNGLTAVREEMIDKIAIELASIPGHEGAWVIDMAQGSGCQELRADGRLVWVPTYNTALATTVSPVQSGDGASGTHYSTASCVKAATWLYPFLGNATTKVRYPNGRLG